MKTVYNIYVTVYTIYVGFKEIIMVRRTLLYFNALNLTWLLHIALTNPTTRQF